MCLSYPVLVRLAIALPHGSAWRTFYFISAFSTRYSVPVPGSYVLPMAEQRIFNLSTATCRCTIVAYLHSLYNHALSEAADNREIRMPVRALCPSIVSRANIESTMVKSTMFESTTVESTTVESTMVESTMVESTTAESTMAESTMADVRFRRNCNVKTFSGEKDSPTLMIRAGSR